jgi:hypothetical protein
MVGHCYNKCRVSSVRRWWRRFGRAAGFGRDGANTHSDANSNTDPNSKSNTDPDADSNTECCADRKRGE